MKRIFIAILVILLILLAIYISKTPPEKRKISFPSNNLQTLTRTPSSELNAPITSIIAENLDTPWGIVFLPDQSLLITERPGTVKRIQNNNITTIATLPQVREISEGGLLGVTLHPNFASNNYIYFYYTYSSNGGNTLNRVVRMTYANNSLTDEKVIVDQIPGAANHNGGRIKFGPDKLLYVGTGDAQEPSRSQNTKSLAGKILRVTDDGKIPSGNPFNNPVYSYGHRNVQGLAWDNNGNLWATEHGRSGFPSGLDEINLIQAGKNYGWPTIQGDDTQAGMEKPSKHSGATTWAPAGMGFINNSLFFGGLRGEALYEVQLQNGVIRTFKEHLTGEYGRIREVILGPDGMLYISTSNNDGRGNPHNGDDKIIRINPAKL